MTDSNAPSYGEIQLKRRQKQIEKLLGQWLTQSPGDELQKKLSEEYRNFVVKSLETAQNLLFEAYDAGYATAQNETRDSLKLIR